MSNRHFQQLVDNITRDGCLTSTPTVYRVGDDLVVLSGNHRTKASIAAGLDTITVMEVLGELTEVRRVALQLSHNAITGEDDSNLLRELYESLDVIEQRYTGLTDTDFGILENLDLTKLSLGKVEYQEVLLMFLPEDREVFVNAMESLGKKAAKAARYYARLEDFKAFEVAIVTVQDTLNIHNQALAILAMVELAMERLEQLELTDGADAEAEAEA